MHTLSVTFITGIVQGNENARDDAAALQWIKLEGELDDLIQSQQIAFDHSKILNDYKKWIRAAQGSVQSGTINNATFWSTKNEQTKEALKIKNHQKDK
jgi:urocanate hydratase